MHVILDYGVGNLMSIKQGFKRVGIDTIISKDLEVIQNAKSLILPGVGAFQDAMKALESSGLIPSIKRHVELNKYLFGVCLGMQLLYEDSYEDGYYKGLGILQGSIKKIDTKLKIPHMGWNELTFKKNSRLTTYINENDYVYFVHSFFVDTVGDEVCAITYYDLEIPAIVEKNNVFATQFHPEKSGEVGLNILKAYGDIVK